MIRNSIQRITKHLRGDGLRAQLFRGGAGSLLMKAGQAMLALAVALVLARTLGPQGYGVYSYALAIIMLTAIPAQVGVPQLVVRETAKAQATANYGLMRGVWRWGNVAVALFSILVSAFMAGILWYTDIGDDGGQAAVLMIGIFLIPIISLTNVRSACLRGLRKVVQEQLSHSIIRPALLLLIVLVLVRCGWFVDKELTPQMMMTFYVVAAALAFIVSAWLLRLSRPAALCERPVPEYKSPAWRKAVVPLAMIAGLHLFNRNADLIILGIFRPNEEVGVYRAVFEMSLLAVFVLKALDQVLQPYIVQLYVTGRYEKLQRLVTHSARATLFFALPIVSIFLIFGEQALALAFGEPYRIGAVALGVLGLGHLVNAGIGSVGILLKMTGHEKEVVKGVSVAAMCNVILNFTLIPHLEIAGAAAATATSIAVWNVMLWWAVRRKLGVKSTVFGG